MLQECRKFQAANYMSRDKPVVVAYTAKSFSSLIQGVTLSEGRGVTKQQLRIRKQWRGIRESRVMNRFADVNVHLLLLLWNLERDQKVTLLSFIVPGNNLEKDETEIPFGFIVPEPCRAFTYFSLC